MRFAVFLFVLIGFFTFPIADDYAYAVRTLNVDYWAAWIKEYHTWNGRWASNLVLLLNEQILSNIWLYRAVVALNLLFFYGALKSFFPKRIGAIIFLIYLGAAAAFSENFYWLTGAITYTTPIALQLFGLSILFKNESSRIFSRSSSLLPSARLPDGQGAETVIELVPERSRRGSRDALFTFHSSLKSNWFIAILLISFSSGFNEVIMAINLFLAFVLIPQLGKKVGFLLIPLLIVSAFMILAPGNTVRSDLFSNNHRIFYSLYMSLAQTIRFAAKSIIFLPLPLAMIWIYMHKLRWPLIEKLKGWQFLLLAFGPLFIACFMPYWATGILGQHRTPTVGQFYFISTCLIFPVWLKSNVHIVKFLKRLGLSLKTGKSLDNTTPCGRHPSGTEKSVATASHEQSQSAGNPESRADHPLGVCRAPACRTGRESRQGKGAGNTQQRAEPYPLGRPGQSVSIYKYAQSGKKNSYRACTYSRTPHSEFRIPHYYLIICILIGFIVMGNSGHLIRDLITGSSQKNAQLQQTRIDQIQSACKTNKSTLYFEPLDTTALFVIDISSNPNHWINIHQAKYLCPDNQIQISRKE